MATDITNDDGTLNREAATAVLDAYSPAADRELTTPTEEKKEGEAAAGVPKQEQPPKPKEEDKEPAPPKQREDWQSAEDLRDLVESLGLSEQDLAEFTSREEFDRHVRFVDKTIMREGKRALSPGDEQAEILAAQEEAARRQQLAERAKSQPRERGRFVKAEDEADVYKPQISPDEIDESIVEEFQRLGEHATRRIQALEEELAEMRAERAEERNRRFVESFDSIVDGLGHADIFGNSKSLQRDTDEFKARAKLWDAAGVLIAGLDRLGKPAGMSAALVRRALNQEFADELSKKERKQLTDKIRTQASQKLGGSPQRTSVERPYNGPPEKDPYWKEVYDKILERER